MGDCGLEKAPWEHGKKLLLLLANDGETGSGEAGSGGSDFIFSYCIVLQWLSV